MRIYPQLLVDQEFKSLGDQGFMGTLNDRQFAFLRSKGYVNALPDMMTSWLSYSPANLFALNEPGIWLDPSDVANLDWRRNLLLWTEQFDNATWIKSNATVTANAAVAPNGTTTADKLVENTANATHGFIVGASFTSGVAVTLSAFAKAGERAFLQIAIALGAQTDNAFFNLTTGSVGTASVGVSTSITNMGDGWYRCAVTITPNSTGSGFYAVRLGNADNSNLYTGDGTSGILIWGAQLELGSVATDYQRITDVNTEVLERFPRTTMYQDRAGSTAVTTPGQSVGLRLDKSKGLVLGSELVTNGAFDSDTSWGKGTGWTISGGVASKTAGTASNISQNIGAVAGKTYQITFTATVSSGAVSPNVGGADGTSVSVSGTYTQRLLATGTNSDARLFGNSSFAGSIDNISVKELPGNHAVANSDAARGIYGIEPLGGRRNLLTFTEQFDNAAWVKTAATITANSETAPDGTLTADRVEATGIAPSVSQDIVVNSTSVTLSAYFKKGTAATAANALLIRNQTLGTNLVAARVDLDTGAITYLTGSSGAASESVGNGWWKLTLTASITSGNTVRSGILGGYPATVGHFSFIWGAQLEASATATAYQRVTTQYDVTEAGKQTLHYVQYDGSDDGYVTPTISPESALVVSGSELVANGDFAGGTTGWTNVSTGTGTFTVASGVATLVGVDASNRGATLQGMTCVVGRPYEITATVTGAQLNLALGTGVALDGTGGASTTGTGSVRFIAVATSTTMNFKAWSIAAGGTATIDNISVREMSGVADKVQVFAGVRKLSDAATGVVVELSATSASNNGSFHLAAPSLAGTYGWFSRGTTRFEAQTPTSFNAPITNVVTGIGDISGDNATVRVNGAQSAQNTGDQGTGNYLAYLLYIGRRGGTSLPFNGRDYGIVVRFGANLDASTIAATESWLNQRTGAF